MQQINLNGKTTPMQTLIEQLANVKPGADGMTVITNEQHTAILAALELLERKCRY